MKKALLFAVVFLCVDLYGQDYFAYLKMYVAARDTSNNQIYKYLNTSEEEALVEMSKRMKRKIRNRLPNKYFQYELVNDQRSCENLISGLMNSSDVSDSLVGLPGLAWVGVINKMTLRKFISEEYNRKISLSCEYYLYNNHTGHMVFNSTVVNVLDSMAAHDFMDAVSEKLVEPLLQQLPQSIQLSENDYKIVRIELSEKHYSVFRVYGSGGLARFMSDKESMGHYFGATNVTMSAGLCYINSIGISIGADFSVDDNYTESGGKLLTRKEIKSDKETLSTYGVFGSVGYHMLKSDILEYYSKVFFGRSHHRSLTEYNDTHVRGSYKSAQTYGLEIGLSYFPFKTHYFGLFGSLRYTTSELKLDRYGYKTISLPSSDLTLPKHSPSVSKLQFFIGINSDFKIM